MARRLSSAESIPIPDQFHTFCKLLFRQRRRTDIHESNLHMDDEPAGGVDLPESGKTILLSRP